jgi:hypothetical protein
MKNIKYLGIGFFLTIISCNQTEDLPERDRCGDQFTANIKSDDLKNCKYKTSSYWIFMDSVNNEVDSLFIVNFEQGFMNDICGNSYEFHSFELESSQNSESTDYVIVAGGLFKDFDGSPNTGLQIYDDYSTSTSMTNYVVEKLDSILINNQKYMTVLKVEIEDDRTEDHNKSIYFINSEFGFLRHEIYSNGNMISKKILIRKNIIK